MMMMVKEASDKQQVMVNLYDQPWASLLIRRELLL